MIKLNGQIVNVSSFPDGTPLLRIPPDIHRHQSQDVFTWNFEGMEELFILTCLVKQRRSIRKGISCELELPFIPNARQDRTQNADDVFTLKWFCEAINELNFDGVVVHDAHSAVALALLNRVEEVPARRFVNFLFTHHLCQEKIDLLFYPDAGAEKKYAHQFLKSYAFGVKQRDWRTGEITDLQVIGDVKDKNVLIVDDICSKGGTFYKSALKLKELGAKKVWLYVTHCEKTIFDGELLKSDLIEHVFTTSSIYHAEHEKISVIGRGWV